MIQSRIEPSKVKLFNMKEANEPAYLEDLKSFRWHLYHYRHSPDIIKCLTKYYFKKYYFQHFAEELIISGYDLQKLNGEIRLEIYLQIPNLSHKGFPSILTKDDRFWDINRLFICLIYGNQLCFIDGLKLIAEKRPNDLCKLFVCIGFLLWQLESWLNPSVFQFLVLVKEKLSAESIIHPSLIDMINIYQSRFNYWRGKRYENIVHIIDAVLPEPKFRFKKMIEHFDREECLDILIDWDLNITTQLHRDRTALYHAVDSNNLNVINKLLSKGSFIGTGTSFSDSNICNIDAAVLEKHFDSCITKCIDDDRFIEIDFKNMIAPPKECKYCDGSCSDEMKAIELISNSENHKHLLVHPLISTFVLLKWNRLAFILYIDFILYTLFTLSTIGYILTVGNVVETYVKIALTVSTAILTMYIALRRILHQIFRRIYHISKIRHAVRNYMQCAVTAFIVFFVVLLLLDVSEYYSPILATICILLIACEIFILAGSLFWSFSKYYVMFLDVALSSIKSLQLCAILVPTFALSFYLLLWDQPVNNGNIFDNKNNRNNTNVTHSFSTLGSSIVKTIAMSASEFEASISNFQSGAMSSYLFLSFTFLITVVFTNLMNGLAVGNTQRIQSDAEATSLVQRAGVLAHYEGAKACRKHFFRDKCRDTWVMKILEYFTKIHSIEALHPPFNTKIYIAADNRVLILRKDYKTAEQPSVMFDQNGTYLHSWISYFCFSNQFLRVDPKIVHLARRILERKESIQMEENEKNHLKNRIAKMESELQKVVEMAKVNEENTKHHVDTIMHKLDAIGADALI